MEPVTSNKDEECLKELLAAHHHNLRISRRIRGRPGHVQPPAPAALLSAHGWIASNMTSYPATRSFCNVDIVYFWIRRKDLNVNVDFWYIL